MPIAWYVLHSKPNKEEILRQQLHSKKIDHFYPCIAVTPVNPRSRKILPYFPGYIFVQLDLANPIADFSLKWTPGAVGLVSFDGRPAEVPEILISSLKNRLTEEVLSRRQEHQFKQGDKVRVVSGPFEGYEGIFDVSLSGTNRVRFLIELLKDRALKIEMPVNNIKNISEKS